MVAERMGIRRLLFGTGRPGDGPGATYYGFGAIACGFGAIVGLVTGYAWGAVLLIPAGVFVVATRRAARERSW